VQRKQRSSPIRALVRNRHELRAYTPPVESLPGYRQHHRLRPLSHFPLWKKRRPAGGSLIGFRDHGSDCDPGFCERQGRTLMLQGKPAYRTPRAAARGRGDVGLVVLEPRGFALAGLWQFYRRARMDAGICCRADFFVVAVGLIARTGNTAGKLAIRRFARARKRRRPKEPWG